MKWLTWIIFQAVLCLIVEPILECEFRTFSVQLLYHGTEILLIAGLFFGSIQLLILCLLGEYTQDDLGWSNKWVFCRYLVKAYNSDFNKIPYVLVCLANEYI